MRELLGDLEKGSPEENDPVRRSEAARKRQLPKRFYKLAAVEALDDGFTVVLDSRPVRTPARNSLFVPSRQLAETLAAEWNLQDTHIDPALMPLTRMINTAIDGVSTNADAVRAEMAAYALSDLVCYRAGSPEGLVRNQSELWDPVLEWAARSLHARFVLAEGVMHVDQPREGVEAIAGHLDSHRSPLVLTALHVTTTMTGSVLLAAMLAEGAMDAETAWRAAHVDEDWNIAQWGEDAEAAVRRAARRKEFDAAMAILSALRKRD